MVKYNINTSVFSYLKYILYIIIIFIVYNIYSNNNLIFINMNTNYFLLVDIEINSLLRNVGGVYYYFVL